ncbi:MAG: permease-like cell division protein FtsX [Actinomycetota bacterium]|nr:permease-like cell division protein FtsX [Actinomycetota bacterium]
MGISVQYTVRQTMSNLWRNRLMTIAATLTVAVSLSLVGAAILLQQGVSRAAGVWKGGVQLIVFMQPQASQADTAATASLLASDSMVRSSRYVNQQQSYVEFKNLFAGQKDLISAVTPADLPPSFRVTLRTAKDAGAVGARLGGRPGVKKVAYNQAGIRAMLKVTGALQDVIVGLAVVLLVSASVLILNTIRMAIFGRRREVAVMKLVGASNWFIRVPFMMEGLVQGLLGGALAAIVLVGVRSGVQSLVARFQVNALNAVVVPGHEALLTQLLLLLIGSVVGAAGSALAVHRFLDV